MTTDPANRALATVGASRSIALQLAGDERRLKVLKDVIAKGCTDEELEVFAAVAQRTRLDPFAAKPQIYAIKRWDGKAQSEVLTIQTSIDGFRLIAQRSGKYAGQAGPYWCGPDGKWLEVWLSDDKPAAARVGVRLRGVPEPVWGVAVWKRAAVYQNVYEGRGENRRKTGTQLSPFWERMGPEMLAVAAERNAIRRACPQDTYGLELADPAELEALQAEQSHNAARYTEIFGDDGPGGSGSAYDLDRGVVKHAGRTVDMASGEVLDDPREQLKPRAAREVPNDQWESEPDEDPVVNKYAALQELLGEAKKRGLSGQPAINHSPDADLVQDAIDYWVKRIREYELDQQAQRDADRSRR